MSEPARKCKNNAIFRQNYSLKLFLLVNWHTLIVLALGEIRFPSKNFYNINYWINYFKVELGKFLIENGSREQFRPKLSNSSLI